MGNWLEDKLTQIKLAFSDQTETNLCLREVTLSYRYKSMNTRWQWQCVCTNKKYQGIQDSTAGEKLMLHIGYLF